MKGIDKKACLENLIPAREPDPDCGLFLIKKLRFIVCTEIKIIGHRRLLILYLYSKKEDSDEKPELVFTTFQATNTFITYAHGAEVKTRWREAMLLNLNRQSCYCCKNHFAFYSKEDEQRVFRFFKSLNKKDRWETGIDAIWNVQEDIRREQQRQRRNARKRVIREKMRALRPLPRDLNDWLRKQVLPAYFFYDSKRRDRSAEGVCSACGHMVTLERVKHNDTGTCPHCGRSFTMKSNKKRGYIWNRITASVVQRYDQDKLIIRIIKGHYKAPKGKAGWVDYYEETRVIVGMDQEGYPFEEAYHEGFDGSSITPWEKGYPPVFYLYSQNFNAETCGFLYCRNLDRELAGTPWQYCQLKAYYESTWEQMTVSNYLQVYRMIPAIEFFVKLKLYWLVTHLVYKTGYQSADQVIDPRGKNLREVLRIDPSDVQILQRPGNELDMLLLLQIFRAEGYQPDIEFLEWAIQYGVRDRSLLKTALQYTTPHRVKCYIDQQFKMRKADSKWECSGVVSDYRDYLGFCEKLRYDLKDEFILFPRDLKRAHDQAQSMVKLEDAKRYDQQVAKAEKHLRRHYQFSSDGLVVLPPHTAREIVAEGQRLHHCVGGYVNKVVNGKCAILFLRKMDEQETPFYTVEVQGDTVIQVRGFENCGPTQEVQQFLKAWLKKKHLEQAA